jgi:hypothetical protein
VDFTDGRTQLVHALTRHLLGTVSVRSIPAAITAAAFTAAVAVAGMVVAVVASYHVSAARRRLLPLRIISKRSLQAYTPVVLGFTLVALRVQLRAAIRSADKHADADARHRRRGNRGGHNGGGVAARHNNHRA